MDLICLNDGIPTFINRPNENSSILDLSFINPELYTYSHQRVWNDSLGSDHYPVSTHLRVQVAISKFSTHKYNLKKTDWIIFNSNLKSNLNSKLSSFHSETVDPVQKYNIFTQCIDEAIASASPVPTKNNTINQVNNKKSFVSAPWWNNDCDKATEDRRNALNTFKQQASYKNYIAYKKFEAKTKRTLNEARRKSFQKFCNSLDRTTPIKRVWKTVKIFKNRFSQPATASFSSDTETIAKLNDIIKDMCPPTTFFNSFPDNFQQNQFLSSNFSITELNIAISATKIKSAAALDKFNNVIIQKLPSEAKLILLDIFNQIISTGSFPSSWNEFLIFSIPKLNTGPF